MENPRHQRYSSFTLIKEGGDARVYRCIDRVNDLQVAFKWYRPEQGEMGRVEGERLYKLSHPYIVRVLDYGTLPKGGGSYLVMELIAGNEAVEACSGLDLGPKMAILGKIAIGLQYLHANAIVHRDIKSNNIIVIDGRVTIIDLGASCELGYDPLFRGTLPYAAPEQFFRLGIDRAADLYSFGVLIARVLWGKYPRWAPDFEGWQRLHSRRERVDLRPLSELNDEFRQMVAKLLDHDPGNRGTIDQVVRIIDNEQRRLGHLFAEETRINAQCATGRLNHGNVEQVKQDFIGRFWDGAANRQSIQEYEGGKIVSISGGVASQREELLWAIIEEARRRKSSVLLDGEEQIQRWHKIAQPGDDLLTIAVLGDVPISIIKDAVDILRSFDSIVISLSSNGYLFSDSSGVLTPLHRIELATWSRQQVTGFIERNFPIPVGRYLRYRMSLLVTPDDEYASFASLIEKEIALERIGYDSCGWFLAEERITVTADLDGVEDEKDPDTFPPLELNRRLDSDIGNLGIFSKCKALLPSDDAVESISFLLGRLLQHGLYDQLERCCTLVLETQTKFPTLHDYARLNLAKAASVRGDNDAALSLLDQISEQAGVEFELESAILKANVAMRQGDLALAEMLLVGNLRHRSIPEFPQISSNTLLNMGIVRGKKGEYSAALTCYFDALDIKRRHRDPSGVVSLYSNIGTSYHLMGNQENALCFYRRASEEAERIDDYKSYVIARFNEGDLLLDRECLLEAAVALDAALQMARRIGFSPVIERARLYLDYIGAFKQKNVVEALVPIEEYLDRASERGNIEDEILATTLIGKLYKARGELGKARKYFHNAMQKALEIRHQRLIREIDQLVYRLDEAEVPTPSNGIAFQPDKTKGDSPNNQMTIDPSSGLSALMTLVRQSIVAFGSAETNLEHVQALLGLLTGDFGFARAAYIRKKEDGSWQAIGMTYDGDVIGEAERRLPLALIDPPNRYPSAITNIIGSLPGFETIATSPQRFQVKTILVTLFSGSPCQGLYLDHSFLAPEDFLDDKRSASLTDLLWLLSRIIQSERQTPAGEEKSSPINDPDQLDSYLPSILAKSVTFSLVHKTMESGRGGRQLGPLGYLIGTSTALAELYQQMEHVARTDVPVLIEGESGSGKEVVARAIHDLSKREKQAIVVQNCAAIPKELAESILFGHVKGAFTGALERHDGLLVQADKGTLFLDEIGELPISQQASLLRVLQERRVRPVGGTEEIVVDFRLLAATNRTLKDEVGAGRFREDLYYRLQVVVLRVPPLRERSEDIPLLVDYFNRTESKILGGEALSFSTGAIDVLLGYTWPGNVRELKNVISRLLVFTRGKVSASQVNRYLNMEKRPLNEVALGPDQTLKQYLLHKERIYIKSVLDHVHGNVSKAADLLGMSRVNVYNRMKKLGMSRSSQP